MENIILETKNLRREFGALIAVADVSVKVKAGSFHSIIGPNGAGKTTFFNLLSGNLKPTSGQVIFKGNDITKFPLHKTAHLGIGRLRRILCRHRGGAAQPKSLERNIARTGEAPF